MKCPFIMRNCTKCKKLLVANEINFSKAKNGKYGLNSVCKECKHKSYIENKKDISKKQKIYRENHKSEIKEKDKKYREKNKEKLREKSKQYYKNNKEHVLEYQKKYREENKEKIKEYMNEYYLDNCEDIKDRIRDYNKNNPQIRLNSHNKRRALKENGEGITKEQWLEMMEFFNWCCAYSGEYIGGDNNKNRSIDHIISLNKNGEHEVWNCVPMYRRYNSSKMDNDMIEWYMRQDFFDINRLMRIYEWQEYAFKKWYQTNN